MNNPASPAAGGSRKVHRRYAHLTRDDVELLNALDAHQAREMERLIRAQHRDEVAHRASCASVSPDALERLAGHPAARYRAGAGGGRRRRTHRSAA